MSQDPIFNRSMGQPLKPPVIGDSRTSGKAIASIVLGFLSIVGMCFTGIPGLILGILGLGDVNRSNGRVGGKGVAIFGIVLSSLGIVWTIFALLIAMLLPAVGAVRGAAHRTKSMNNIRQMVLSMHNYESAHGEFPQVKSGLSWRVHILPFIEHNNLYDRFHLDEPWDSPHNIQLLAEMPEVYDCPSVGVLPPGFTVYQVPYTDVAKHPGSQDLAIFDTSGKPVRFGNILDGSSNTAMVLEVDESAAVEWTKPNDWEYDPADPKRDLGHVHLGVIQVGMADGSTQAIPNSIGDEGMKALITREAGDVPPLNYNGY